ncbi:MAG TPA: DUF3592 domain-containing protein [Victivallales bacterium]|nr:DUF3592 domain-containing protein [Victivallales bacterium]
MQANTKKEMGPATKFFFKRIFPLIFIASGIFATFFLYKTISFVAESRNWPFVEGIIKVSSVQFEDRVGQKGMYSAEIMYEYAVDGKIYNSNKISALKSSSTSPNEARELVNKYPVNSKIKVYYSPADPQRSLLETGVSQAMWLLMLIGPIFLIIGLLILIFIPKLIDRDKCNKGAEDE